MAVFRKGNAEIEVSEGLAEIAARVLEKGLERTSAAMDQARDEIFADAQRDAPIKSGKFKAGMVKGRRLRAPNFVESFIRFEDPKSKFVKGKKQGGRVSVTVLVRRPFRRRLKELAAILQREMVALSEGR